MKTQEKKKQNFKTFNIFSYILQKKNNNNIIITTKNILQIDLNITFVPFLIVYKIIIIITINNAYTLFFNNINIDNN